MVTPKQVHVLLPVLFRQREYGLALTLYQDTLNCLEADYVPCPLVLRKFFIDGLLVPMLALGSPTNDVTHAGANTEWHVQESKLAALARQLVCLARQYPVSFAEMINPAKLPDRSALDELGISPDHEVLTRRSREHELYGSAGCDFCLDREGHWKLLLGDVWSILEWLHDCHSEDSQAAVMPVSFVFEMLLEVEDALTSFSGRYVRRTLIENMDKQSKLEAYQIICDIWISQGRSFLQREHLNRIFLKIYPKTHEDPPELSVIRLFEKSAQWTEDDLLSCNWPQRLKLYLIWKRYQVPGSFESLTESGASEAIVEGLVCRPEIKHLLRTIV